MNNQSPIRSWYLCWYLYADHENKHSSSQQEQQQHLLMYLCVYELPSIKIMMNGHVDLAVMVRLRLSGVIQAPMLMFYTMVEVGDEWFHVLISSVLDDSIHR